MPKKKHKKIIDTFQNSLLESSALSDAFFVDRGKKEKQAISLEVA